MRGKVIVVAGLALSVLMVVSATAGMTIGGKAWMQDISFQYEGDNELTADGIAVGPQISIDMGDYWWLSANWLIGEFEWDTDEEMTTQDAEAVLGLSFDILDMGVGFRYSQDEFGGEETSSKYGPMVYLGTGSTFGDSPFGWYVGASWMFLDLNDDWDWGEHYNVEGGLSCYLEGLSATVGYRVKDHYDSDNDLQYKGVTASLAISL